MASLVKEQLQKEFVGKSLSDGSYSISSPAAILDIAVLETNCKRMLEAVETLGLGWRPHVKTHKVRLLLMPAPGIHHFALTSLGQDD